MGRRVQGGPSVSPRVRAGTTEIPERRLTLNPSSRSKTRRGRGRPKRVWISHDTSECRASEVRLRTYCKGEGYPPAKFNTHTSATCRERPRAGGHRRRGGLGMMAACIQSGWGARLLSLDVMFGDCKFDKTCRFNHPPERWPGMGHLWGHRPSTR